MAASFATRAPPGRAQIADVARRHRVAIAGAGAQGLDPGPDVLVLADDPVAEAERVSAMALP